MRYFNTSGPNIIEQHYTLIRTDLILEGIRNVRNDRYFTIWAPRQTGKSTYFRQLSTELVKEGYKIAHIADITIDINGQKAVVESKVYHNITQFKNGKTQTAYCNDS